MFISPMTAIKEGWVKFPDWMNEEQRAKCVQPNALDYTIDRISEISNDAHCIIGETHKTMRPLYELSTQLERHSSTPHWVLQPKSSYDYMSDFYVDLPTGVAALLVIRSTFNRNGIFITSGLFDTGYIGHCAGVIHNNSGPVSVEQHVRVGQLIFVQSDSVGKYAGGWNHSQGTHYTEEK